jgi:hypothetical protein
MTCWTGDDWRTTLAVRFKTLFIGPAWPSTRGAHDNLNWGGLASRKKSPAANIEKQPSGVPSEFCFAQAVRLRRRHFRQIAAAQGCLLEFAALNQNEIHAPMILSTRRARPLISAPASGQRSRPGLTDCPTCRSRSGAVCVSLRPRGLIAGSVEIIGVLALDIGLALAKPLPRDAEDELIVEISCQELSSAPVRVRRQSLRWQTFGVHPKPIKNHL